MSETHLHIDVVNRHTTLWSGEAEYVSIPAVDGKLGVLPGRQPVLAVLASGDLEVTGVVGGEGEARNVRIEVAGGFASVDSDFVTVVVDEGSVVGS